MKIEDEINYNIVEDIQHFIIDNNIPILSTIYYVPKYNDDIGPRYYVHTSFLSRRLIDKVSMFEIYMNYKYDSKIMVMMSQYDYTNNEHFIPINNDNINIVIIKEIKKFLLKYNIGSKSSISFNNHSYNINIYKTSNKQYKAINKFKMFIKNIYNVDVNFN